MREKFHLLLTGVLLSFLVVGCGGEEDKTPGSKEDAPQTTGDAIRVEGWLAEPRPLDDFIMTSGSILPNESIELRTEINGRITGIFFEEGEEVKKGQKLVQINDEEFSANLKRARAQLRTAENDFERKKKLMEINGVSREEYENSETRVAELKAEISVLETQIRNARIEAPFTGVIGLRAVSPGAYLSAGERIAHLVQSDPLKIEFTVPERYARRVHTGQMIEFRLSNAIDSTHRAEIYAADPRVEAASRNLKVRARTPNPGNRIIPGSFAEIKVVLDRDSSAIMVPSESIVPRLEGESVFVVRGNKSKNLRVKTGSRDEKMVHIRHGINPGDTVITTGLLGMEDGTPVEVKKLNRRVKQKED